MILGFGHSDYLKKLTSILPISTIINRNFIGIKLPMCLFLIKGEYVRLQLLVTTLLQLRHDSDQFQQTEVYRETYQQLKTLISKCFALEI